MYYSAKTSRHRLNGLSYVPKKWMLREARGGRKGTEGNRVTTKLLLYPIVFCSFLFLSTRILFSLAVAGYAQACQHIFGIVGLCQAEV